MDMVKSQEAGRNQHDQFHAQLEKAEDGFGLVAEYFGRGLFSSPLPVPTASIATSQFRAPQQLETNIPQSEGRLRLETRGENFDYSPLIQSMTRWPRHNGRAHRGENEGRSKRRLEAVAK